MNIDFTNEHNDNFCIINLHYRFSDNSHTMNALVQNKCERAFLLLLQSIAKTLREQVTIEIEPHLEGGLINQYRIRSKKPNNKGKMPESVKIALLTAIFLAPTTVVINGINEIVKSVVSDRFKDPTKDSLEKDKLRLEIEKLHLEINKEREATTEDDRVEQKLREDKIEFAIIDFRSKLIKIDTNKSANINRIKFYKELAKYEKINSVGTQVINAGLLPKTQEFVVQKDDFISVASDMSKDLKKLDRATMLWGEDSDSAWEIKNKISKNIDSPKTIK